LEKLDTAALYRALSDLRREQTTIERAEDGREKIRVSQKHRDGYRTLLNIVSEQLGVIGVSRTALKRLLIDLEGEKFSYGGFNLQFKALDRLLKDELSEAFLLALTSKELSYFEPTAPLFGKLVEDQFPCLIDEIGEAGKCYALGRGTACAFHSIRCLEAGIRALSRCLQIPDPTRACDRNWGAMLKIVKDKIDARWPGSSTRLAGDGEFFDNAYAGLAAMQNPWRNSTMHLDQKYTLDEAKHIFEVVKGFMTKLASRMNEDGQPLAWAAQPS